MLNISGVIGKISDKQLVSEVIASCAFSNNEVFTRILDTDCIVGISNTFSSQELYIDNHVARINDYDIIWDGQIFNRDHIISLLAITSDNLKSDPILVLMGYIKFGDAFFKMINAEFIALIYDRKSRCLLIFKDIIGTKPMYYTNQNNAIIFASSIGQLLNFIPNEINEQYIFYGFTCYVSGSLQIEETAWKNIYRLLPAHYVKIRTDELTLSSSSYWTYNDIKVVKNIPFDECINSYYNLYTKALRARMSARTGFHLSGGLDSSSNVCTAEHLRLNGVIPNDSKIFTYSFRYNDFPEADEGKYIESILSRYNSIQNVSINGDDNYFFKGIFEDDCMVLDEPMCTMMNYAMYAELNRQAKRDNVDVLISGDFGDVINQGNTLYLFDLLAHFKIVHLFKDILYWGSASGANFNISSIINENLLKPLGVIIFKRGINESVDKSNYWLSYGGQEAIQIPHILSYDFLRKHEHLQLARILTPDLNCKLFQFRSENRIIFSESGGIAAYTNLNIHNYNFDVTSPYRDKELLEFCLGIPPLYKMSVGTDKRIKRKELARSAMRDVVPDKIRTRYSREDYGRVFDKGFRKYLLTKMGNDVDSFEIVQRNYVDRNYMSNAINQWRIGFFDENLGLVMYTLTLEAWLQGTKHKTYNYRLANDAIRKYHDGKIRVIAVN